MKKALIVVLSMMMALSMSAPAFAQDGDSSSAGQPALAQGGDSSSAGQPALAQDGDSSSAGPSDIAFEYSEPILTVQEEYFTDDEDWSEGWNTYEGDRYYVSDGELLTGWQEIDGQRYYFDDDGVMAYTVTKIGNKNYFFNEDGLSPTGWQKVNIETEDGPVTLTYYVKNDGTVASNFTKIGGKRYLFSNEHSYIYSEEEMRQYNTYGALYTYGIYKNYVISYTGECRKMPKKKKDRSCKKMAKLIAKCSGKNAKGMSDLEKVGHAAYIVSGFSARCRYTMKGKYYNKPYGVFYAKQYTCAGSTRALGLVLKYMGFKWKHVNAHKNKHQWCKLKMDGLWGWADGQIGMVGYGKHPAR